MATDTVFHKIISGEIPAKKEYEDAECIVIHDISPKAPVHLLVIPKKEMASISHMSTEDQKLVGKLIQVATDMARKFKTEESFRLVINNGEGAGQSVFQLHVHLLGGWKHKPKSDLEL